MKSILALFLFAFTFQIYSQNAKSLYNLGFEDFDNESTLPRGWFERWNKPGYKLSIDSNVKTGGKFSVSIESDTGRKENSFGCIAHWNQINFKGKKVVLKGKMKLENVANGSAGLLLRLDDKNDNTVQFDNMLQRKISGTIDWQEYTVELPLPEEARNIYYAVIINGTGKVWADDFTLEVDGIDINNVEVTPVKTYNAEKDEEFNGGSKIEINELTDTSINNLYILGKVWGFLKYYHPKISEGEYNWDYELFRITPKILNVNSGDERNRVLLEWVNSLGPVTEFSNKNISDEKNVRIMPELDWIKDGSIFSAELITKLEEVKNAKRTDTSYYIGLHEFVGNPNFKNENAYNYTTLDDGYRLLALFRYWNMIQYYFPNRHLISEDWNLVLREFIPEFVNGKSETAYHLNALKLIARIHDSHATAWSTFIDDSRGKYTAPFEITFIEEKPVITRILPLQASQTESAFIIGDEIIAVNGKPVEEIIKAQLPYTPGSNYPTQLRDLAFRFLRTDDTLMSLQFIRDGKKETRDVKCFSRDAYQNEIYSKYRDELKKRMWKKLDNNIGYIYPGTLKRDSVEFIMDKLKDTKGIVIDFRCYPSDFPLFELGKFLMPLPTPFVKFTTGSIESPGLFTTTDIMNVGDTNANYYKGKIIIIVNEITQSSAEYHTMAWRTAPNAKVIGSTTAGADGNVSEINLTGGIRTMISGIGVLTPDGKETQRVGIIPDIEIKQTIKGFKEGKDELLEKAIELIEK